MATAASEAPHIDIAQATPDTPRTGPTTDRIVALDFVRGAALFGILLMNITGFGLPHAYSNPMNAGGAEGANLLSWMIIQIGFEGTQRGLFSMLFGAGIILFTSRLEAAGRTDVGDIYARRNLWLIVFGMVNGFVLLWSGDILYFYGLTALVVFPFRKLGVRALLIIGIAGMLASALWNAKDTADLMRYHEAYAASQVAGAQLDPAQQALAEKWEGALAEYSPSPEAQQDYVEQRTHSYATVFAQVAAETVHAESWYFYRWFFDIFSMMLIGMALFKAGIFTLERSTRFYFALVVIGYGVGLTVNVLETRWVIDNSFSLLAMSQSQITYDLGRLPMTAGHLGLLLLIVRSGIFPLFQHALASVGRMAFTNYLTHSLVCAIFFVGLGYFGELERHQLYYVVFTIWAVQLVISPLWLSRYRMGPLEWLWRGLTYDERPKLRRAEPVTA
ncbi:DUF418 domain-containing protein [Allopontixanthobacter sp.]|uniref:DUF418 domain-containing protein n=1 Tax=Allopontixanthobacter sp. TaxID=2906452 RepID=UPI002ABB522B|nr:DUF418 domain-containing protein [Allopontixanthobacter sp.]MDZ4306723.1 DUF418 domain-containing protein [Allopontixanthobacter sp.]